MQSNNSQFWQPLSHDSHSPDARFYDFFEDSLNQFISTNSAGNQPIVNTRSEHPENSSNNNELNATGIK